MQPLHLFYKVNYQIRYKEGEKEYKENLYILDSDVKLNPGSNYKIATYHNVIVKYEDLGYASIE